MGAVQINQEVYLLALHEPYESSRHPAPINATVVHCRTLLHPLVPQPDGGLMYRCLTEFPDRTPGCVVPLSTLTFELDGGRLWSDVADWEAVVNALVLLSQRGLCDSMQLGLAQPGLGLLGMGPGGVFELHLTDGSYKQFGPADRQRELDQITGNVGRFVVEGAFWPGDDLVPVPAEPNVMPYQPYHARPGPGSEQRRRWGWKGRR